MCNDLAAARNRICKILRDVIVRRVLLFTDRNKQSVYSIYYYYILCVLFFLSTNCNYVMCILLRDYNAFA